MNKTLRYGFLLLSLCSYYLARTQIIKEDTTSREPFFKAKKFDSKCYVGFEAIATQILKTKAAMNLGMNLNWIINHKYVVSARYHILTTPVNVQRLVAPDRNDSILLKYQSAGLGFSYILFHNKKFSLQPELSGSWAKIKYEYGGGRWLRHFGVIIPAVYGVYNATKHFRLGVGLNYRVAIGGTLLKDSELNGAGGVVFIRVGTF